MDKGLPFVEIWCGKNVFADRKGDKIPLIRRRFQNRREGAKRAGKAQRAL